MLMLYAQASDTKVATRENELALLATFCLQCSQRGGEAEESSRAEKPRHSLIEGYPRRRPIDRGLHGNPAARSLVEIARVWVGDVGWFCQVESRLARAI